MAEQNKFDILVKHIQDSYNYYKNLNQGFTEYEGAYYDGKESILESLVEFIDEEFKQ